MSDEGLDEAIRAVLEYDREHPASGGLRERLDTLFNRWNAAALAARSEPQNPYLLAPERQETE